MIDRLSEWLLDWLTCTAAQWQLSATVSIDYKLSTAKLWRWLDRTFRSTCKYIHCSPVLRPVRWPLHQTLKFCCATLCIAHPMPWRGVCLYVCLSVTFMYCTETVNISSNFFSSYSSHTILVFANEIILRNSDVINRNGDVKCTRYRDVRPISRCSAPL